MLVTCKKTILVMVLLVGGVSCNSQELEADRFIAALVQVSRASETETKFQPRRTTPYSIALFPKGPIDQDILRNAGLSGARLEGVVQAAPADFESAILIVTPTDLEMGWFLGHYALVKSPMVVKKAAGETTRVTLAYGGSLPEITSIQ
jgi:hypothetical protein